MKKCPYCNEELIPVDDGVTEWRCASCSRWIEPFELDRAAGGYCPWCGSSTATPKPRTVDSAEEV